MRELLRLSNICAADEKGNQLNHYNLVLFQDEIVVLSGDYGSGKQLIQKIIEGSLLPVSGEIFLYGEKQDYYDQDIALKNRIYCINPGRYLVHSMPIADNVFAIRPKKNPFLIYNRRKAELQVNELLNLTGVGYLQEKDIDELSLFEEQIICLVKVMINRPKLIVIDCAQFQFGREEHRIFRKIIAKIRLEGVAVLIIADSPEIMGALCDRYLTIKNGTDFRERHDFPEACMPLWENQKTNIEGKAGNIGFYDDFWRAGESFREYMLSALNGFVRPEMWEKLQKASLVPENSAFRLLENLSIEENLGIAVSSKVANKIGLIDRKMLSYLKQQMSERTGIPAGRVTIGELTLSEKKIFSIYLKEITGSTLVILENPFFGLGSEEKLHLKKYLTDVQRTCRYVIFSANREELSNVCEEIYHTSKKSTFS